MFMLVAKTQHVNYTTFSGDDSFYMAVYPRMLTLEGCYASQSGRFYVDG